MTQSAAAIGTGFPPRTGRSPAPAIWAAVTVVMIGMALANPISRDEGQYVGSIAVGAGLRPYVDFLYLQTPLQAALITPFASLFPGFAFIALRVATAIIGAMLLGLVYRIQRGLGVEHRRALWCSGLLGAGYTVQFASGVVRNDVLPALLATLGLQAALMALTGRLRAPAAWFAVGLLFGAATSAKPLYVIPMAGVAGVLAFERLQGRSKIAPIIAYLLGSVVGLLPCVLAWLRAPDAFSYGVLTFQSTASIPWYRIDNRSWVLTPFANLPITLGVSLVGPAAGATLMILSDLRRRGWTAYRSNSVVLLLDVVIASGVVAALLPTPSNFQYLLPALPALFVRLGLLEDDLVSFLKRAPQSGALVALNALPDTALRPRNRLASALLSLGALVGVGYGVVVLDPLRLVRGDWPAVTLTRQAHWIGAELRKRRVAGLIVTLSPQYVLDTGFKLDPRFATGVQGYRGAYQSTPRELERFKFAGPANLAAVLDRHPPAAVIFGGNARLDDGLRDYAAARGFARDAIPDSRKYELDIRPQ